MWLLAALCQNKSRISGCNCFVNLTTWQLAIQADRRSPTNFNLRPTRMRPLVRSRQLHIGGITTRSTEYQMMFPSGFVFTLTAVQWPKEQRIWGWMFQPSCLNRLQRDRKPCCSSFFSCAFFFSGFFSIMGYYAAQEHLKPTFRHNLSALSSKVRLPKNFVFF